MIQIDENPELILFNIKELLNIGVKNRKHTFHTPVFCNHCKNNISSRIVVLRKFDKKSMTINFNTDFRSPKIKDLKKNNKSFFVFYDFQLKIQLRINTHSTINNKNDITKKIWNKTSLSSRKCYLSKKAPGTETVLPEDGIPMHLLGTDPNKKESENGYENFTVIENKITNIDWLKLSASGHRRLKINFLDLTPGYSWLIP